MRIGSYRQRCCGCTGVSVADPRPANEGEWIAVNSLLNAEGLRRLVTEMVTNFTSFAPLGTVLVAMLGVGVAEHSGLLSASMRALVLNRSPNCYLRGSLCRHHV